MSSVGVDRQPELVSRPDAGIFAALIARPVILGLLLVVATVALYYPVHGHPFVNFDDNDYVYDNPQIQSGLSLETVKWAFTTSIAANWHPLTWLSHALDCQLFGDSPAGPHDVNVLLHVLDAVLLFWVLLRATGYAGRSFMVAALFALHPLNVESVAWIAERKTMLSAAFFLLALGAYRWYAHQPRVGRYAVVALLFALGLMAKPQIIMLPLVLLLWDYWPLQRISFPFNKESTQPRPAAGVSGQNNLVALVRKTSAVRHRFSQCGDHHQGPAWSQELVSAHFPCRKRNSLLWPVLEKYVLAVAPCADVPTRWSLHQLVACVRISSGSADHHSVGHSGPPLSLLVGWLVLVPDNAAAHARYRASRDTGYGRPVCLPFGLGDIPHGLLGRGRLGRAKASFRLFVLGECRCAIGGVTDGTQAARLLAKQRTSLVAQRAGHEAQLVG